MATYKLNTFHWHLTEDQGWRIEIKNIHCSRRKAPGAHKRYWEARRTIPWAMTAFRTAVFIHKNR